MPGPPLLAQSTHAVAPSQLPADGVATALATLTERDLSGNPVAGLATSFAVSGSDRTVEPPAPDVTGADGQVRLATRRIPTASRATRRS